MTSTERVMLKKTSLQRGGASSQLATSKAPVPTLDDMLKASIVTNKTDPFTHTSMEGGKYFISDENLETFYDAYHRKAFLNCASADMTFLSLVERHEGKDYFPLICDLDMKFSSPEPMTHGYDLEFVRAFLLKFMTIIERYLLITDPMMKKAFVMEKLAASPITETTWKDGIHIVFPYIITNGIVQEYIREDLVQEMEELCAVHLKYPLLNSMEDVIDKSILKSNGWMLYGSKKPNAPYRYLLYDEALPCAGIWELGPNTAAIKYEDELYTNQRKLISLCSIRRSSVYDTCEMTETGKNILDDKERLRHKKQKEELKAMYKNCDIHTDTQENVEYARKLVGILNRSRAESYQTWIELGWCLHNIDFRLLDEWVQFSKTCPQYEATAEEDCKEKWLSMRTKGLNIGTLCFWAEMDNRSQYLKIRETTYEGLIRDCCGSIKMSDKSTEPRGSINDSIWYITRVIKKMYEHLFVCSNYEKKEWWDFNGNIWQKSDGAILMRKAIPEDVYAAFNKAFLVYNDKASKFEEDSELYHRNKNLAKSASFIANKIRNPTVKKLIIEEAAELFHWSRIDGVNFEEKLDSSTKLIGMKNGVYDLTYHCFRQGRCDDYISMSTKNEYYQYTWEDPLIKQIMDFIAQVIPNASVRNYLLKTFASCLDGSTSQEKFYIFLGCGGNGKSKLMELMQLALGDYSGTLSVSAITQNRPPSNAPTPEFMRLKGRRFVTFQETNKKEELNSARTKELTGGDTIVARGLNKDPIEYKPQFKLFLCCNHFPKVPPEDGGMWRRLKVILFTSCFVDNPKADNPNEFLRDYDLTVKLHTWKEGFFWILTEYYKYIFQGDSKLGVVPGLKEPYEIDRATNSYRHKCDFVQQFLDHYTQSDAEAFIAFEYGAENIWDYYRYYVKQNNQPQMQKQDLIESIENKFGQIGTNNKIKGWYRHRFLAPEEQGMVNQLESPETLFSNKHNNVIAPPTPAMATTTPATSTRMTHVEEEEEEEEVDIPMDLMEEDY